MKQVLINCPAKVNLFLNVLEKQENGYHDIVAINDTIDIYDRIHLCLSNKFTDNIKSTNKEIPLNENNLVMKAVEAFRDYTKINDYGVHIELEKNIPIQAGLGGGSSDAAGIILALNECLHLNLSKRELLKIALQVGSDVPYFIYGGYRKISGQGEVIASNGENPFQDYLLVLPELKCSTKEMYEKIDDEGIKKVSFDKRMFYNDFERVCKKELIEIKKLLIQYKAVQAGLTGSGSALISAFSNHHERFQAKKELEKRHIKTKVCHSVPGITMLRGGVK